jgi:hypothetical protein
MNKAGDTKRSEEIINPFLVVVATNYILKQQPIAAEEDWLLLNVALMDDIGAKAWLEELLDILSLPQSKYDGHDIVNPGIVVDISNDLARKYELTQTRDEWLDANEKLIETVGSQEWLTLLLVFLKKP